MSGGSQRATSAMIALSYGFTFAASAWSTAAIAYRAWCVFTLQTAARGNRRETLPAFPFSSRIQSSKTQAFSTSGGPSVGWLLAVFIESGVIYCLISVRHFHHIGDPQCLTSALRSCSRCSQSRACLEASLKSISAALSISSSFVMPPASWRNRC